MIALPHFRPAFSGGLDPAIAAFRGASGATDTSALNALARYLRAQGLMSSVRCFPFKAAQNAGSGSTVFGWGDLTANNCTLVNSPTWGASGVTMQKSSSQYATVNDFLPGGNLTVFSRNTINNTTDGVQMLLSQDNGNVARGWYITVLTDGKLRVLRSADGGIVNFEVYNTVNSDAVTADTCYSAQFTEGGGRSVWTNKTNRALTLFAGSAQTSRINSSVSVLSGANLVSSSAANFLDGRKICDLYIAASITDAQREAITDLINAL